MYNLLIWSKLKHKSSKKVKAQRRNCKIPGQGFTLQALVSLEGPEQFFPPFNGVG